MSHEIDDLFEINSTKELEIKPVCSIKRHIFIRWSIPNLVFWIGFFPAYRLNGGFEGIILYSTIISIILIVYFIEMLYYFIKSKNNLGFANIAVFIFLMISTYITFEIIEKYAYII